MFDSRHSVSGVRYSRPRKSSPAYYSSALVCTVALQHSTEYKSAKLWTVNENDDKILVEKSSIHANHMPSDNFSKMAPVSLAPTISHQQLDSRITLAEQLAQSPPVGPVVLMNDHFLDTWRKSGDILKKQPDYISTQLHRSLDGHFLVNYAVWETDEDVKKGLELEEFKKVLEALPSGTVFKPAVMRKIAVSGNCVA
ncbi:uncharacterized protein BDZ83DRAFT_735703 [Colletotrichum acutatum]|uniref:ABM domain-containing protein n=1 Tax=Glomerella acutata TaxID=27357 RepID=A0AAD8U8H8_GLOAC|nr:uncharacterized protein BDZ83DRAFT_735703 [Colletotrichum acutatum]KAK1708444.1 hypothetical protein BDZ83DRAFT_735703 [Colletotrichum acutatum]